MRGEVHILVNCPIDTLQWGSTHSAMIDFIKWSTNNWRLVFLPTRLISDRINQMDFRGCHYELEHGRGCTFVHAPRVAADEYYRTGAESHGRWLMMAWNFFKGGQEKIYGIDNLYWAELRVGNHWQSSINLGLVGTSLRTNLVGRNRDFGAGQVGCRR